jgi:hypothetical protein
MSREMGPFCVVCNAPVRVLAASHLPEFGKVIK